MRIRQGTRHLHQRLESELNFLDPDFSEARYRDLLARLYGFYAAWETVLQPWIEQLNSLGAGLYLKHPELARDLGYFAVDPASVPVCDALPPLGNEDEALGSLYVREGAALGGQIISRHLESALGLSGGNGYRFFSSPGHNVGQEWVNFQGLLLQHSSPQDDEAMILSACTTFECIRCWLCGK